MKGKWAQGLRPRAFTWIIKDRVAASERPGGYARNHRKVRRDEELIWLRQQGFTHVLSLLDSPHNLSAYREAGIAYAHVPLGRQGHEAESLPLIFETLEHWYGDSSELVLVHHEEFGDRLCGVIGGFLLATGLITGEAAAVAVTERLTGRQLGPAGRAIVNTTIMEGLAPRTPPPPPPPEPEPEPARAKTASRSKRAVGARRSSKAASGSTRSKRATTSRASRSATAKGAKSAGDGARRATSKANASSKSRGSTKAKPRAKAKPKSKARAKRAPRSKR